MMVEVIVSDIDFVLVSVDVSRTVRVEVMYSDTGFVLVSTAVSVVVTRCVTVVGSQMLDGGSP